MNLGALFLVRAFVIVALPGLTVLAVIIFGLITGLHVAPGAFASSDRKF
jgi:hypothetical protein